MQRITDYVLKKPVFILTILLIITVFFGYQIYDKARIETNMEKYMPEDHEAFRVSDKYEDLFNIEDAVVVAVENDKGIYHYSTLNKIKKITEELEKIKVVNSDEVNSIITARNIEGTEYGLEIDSFFQGEIPERESELEEIKGKIKNNEMIAGRMVSEDNRVALISAELEDREIDRVELYQSVQKIVKELEGPENFYVAGQPVVEGTLARLMPRDMSKMVPLVILVIIIALLFAFRSFKSTVLTLGVVLFSTIWTFGLMSYLEVPIYVVSTMIPVMLIALGVADGIHLLSHLQQKIKKEDMKLKAAVKDMIKHLWKPVVMTSVTTSVGFISLITSEVYAVKYFGIFTAFGVMVAMVFSLIFIPAGLKILKLPGVKKSKDNKKGKNNNYFYRTSDWILQHKKLIIALSILIVITGIIGLQQVNTESSFLNRFEEDEKIIQANDFINNHFGGTTDLNVILTSEKEDTFKNPAYLNDIWNLQSELKEMKEVGDSFALTDYLRRINKVMNDNSEEFNKIPDSHDLVAQYLLLYSMSGNREDLDRVVDYDYRRLNLRVNLKDDSTGLIKEVIDKIENYAAENDISVLEINYAGSAYTNMVFAELITEGQIKSLVLSIILVMILLALLFKSIKAGMVGSLPIIIAAIINFGIMGYLDISLNVTTALVSSIAVGMGIDYSIHLLSKYKNHGQKSISSRKAARRTMNQSGRAIIFNAVVVISGFLVLTFSNFTTNRELGWLVSLSLFNSFVLTLTLVVVLIDKYKPEFIFDRKENN